MSLPTTTLPQTREDHDLELIEALDFEVELPCEVQSCTEINPVRMPAEWIAEVICPGCPRAFRLLFCDPCWQFITHNMRNIGCSICGQQTPIGQGLRLIGRVR